jgi:tetratricopeptide (TPR) repeat protein
MSASSPKPRSPSMQRVLQQAHVETHDVYRPDDHPEMDALQSECAALYQELRFDEGIARAKRHPNWERDPAARIIIGTGLHYQHRYDEAREEYRTAATLYDRDNCKATCIANVGLTWFEQGDFAQAVVSYEEALALHATDDFALLGMLYVACARRDDSAVVTAAKHLREQRPGWRKSQVIIEILLKDRSVRHLREIPGLFEAAFEVPLEVIVKERFMTAT